MRVFSAWLLLFLGQRFGLYSLREWTQAQHTPKDERAALKGNPLSWCVI
jgi:hypothetical protein